ncbi:methyltetrahydrofolate--corrinoid methyltransferase [bacterium Unc6]|nr:methyltetrahydrofolate--corrinoid methyltransferase [bacterium Unc6]
MIVIGEKINTSRKSVFEAVEKKDEEFIKNLALKQTSAGADMLDINCGTNVGREVEDMKWLVKIVQEVSDVPLCIDSPNPKALEKGLELVKKNGKKYLVNSITAERERIRLILPIVQCFDCDVVALTMDETGMPHTADERIQIAKKIIKMCEEQKVAKERIYFDPLVRPVSTEQEQALAFLNAVEEITKLGAKTTCGLSNISFGLPERGLLNAVFVAMAIDRGLTSALIDPMDRLMMATIKAAGTLLGKDEYCMNYITASREGKLLKTK